MATIIGDEEGDSRDDTQPPRDDTQPPRDDTQPPRDDTQPPLSRPPPPTRSVNGETSETPPSPQGVARSPCSQGPIAEPPILPEATDGVVVMTIPDEILSDPNPLWRCYVVGYFIGDVPHVGSIHATVNRLWTSPKIGTLGIGDLGDALKERSESEGSGSGSSEDQSKLDWALVGRLSSSPTDRETRKRVAEAGEEVNDNEDLEEGEMVDEQKACVN
ncbi:hypothetical protein F2Q70_00016839 [Brassica cretica]|uniref:DUF4283 domain-containing protein n=1 Tax=Brassica cretica TaxID=69181 RepID=A0A8S9I326_BRACR|nr:hypothetical protein F2Q70_00016839 [Brassica cretica]